MNMEGKIRLNSEKKIDNDDFKLKIGTTNKTNPRVIYVEGRTFITPEYDDEDYIKVIDDIKKNFKKKIGTSLSNSLNFDKKFILDFSVASNRMSKGKKTFLSFQFLMRQYPESVKKLAKIKELSNFMINDIVFSLKDDITQHSFSLSKRKK